MTRHVRTLLIAMIVTIVTLTTALVATALRPADAPPSVPTYLFTLSAEAGTLQPTGTGANSYTLTLTGVAGHVTQFADRPYRTAYALDTDDLATHWQRWFSASDPNAVLSYLEPGIAAPGQRVFTLRAPKYDAATASLRFHATHVHRQPQRSPGSRQTAPLPLSPLPVDLRSPSLFIDDATGLTINGCVIEPNTQCPNADLSWADLSNANLTGANLSGANLDGANLQYANLDSANLDGAQANGTNFANAWLGNATWVDGSNCGENMMAGMCQGRSISNDSGVFGDDGIIGGWPI